MRSGLALLVVGALLTGCLDDGPGPTRAHGSDPFVAVGWGYGGAGSRTSGTIEIDTFDRDNTGRVQATWLDERLGPIRLDWTHFESDADYAGGGIVRNLDAHGTTGRGDTDLPQVRYVSAGWGFARLRAGSDFLENPATGEETFRLHYMVLRDALRQASTEKITKADGVTPFDPRRPEDGGTTAGVPQIVLHVRGNGSTVAAHMNRTTQNRTAVGANTHTFALDVAPFADRVRVTAHVVGPAPMAGDVELRLHDAGEEPRGAAKTLSATTASVEFVVAEPKPGRWILRASERGSVSYVVERVLEFPDLPPFERSLTFHDPVVETPAGGG